jgi:DNA-binding transcriptional ArsR family regulator
VDRKGSAGIFGHALYSPLSSHSLSLSTTFPDESSLVGGKLDSFLLSLRRRVSTLQDSITRDVREHAQGRSMTQRAIESASGSIGELFGKISKIKEKASQSEIMVQEICRDIRALDTAKRHLTNTIRALRNLHMLVSAVGQLDFMVAEKQYKLAAERLRAIEDLFTLFAAYGDVPKIRSLRHSVDQTKALMKDQLTSEFHKILPSPLVAQEPQAGLMSDACLVVDVLEPSFKQELFQWFTGLQLDEYSALFGVGKDGGSIDQIDRRYTWLKAWFRGYEQKYSKVFPHAWNVQMVLAKEFCKLTKMQIHKLLQLHVGKGLDVQVMINALLSTIEFEKSLNGKFRNQISKGKKMIGEEEKTEIEEEMSHEDKVEAIKRKYAKKTESEKKEEEEKAKQEAIHAERAAAQGLAPGSTSKSDVPPPVLDFLGLISDCFSPYMNGYIEMERKNLEDLIKGFEKEEQWGSPQEEGRDRLNSSNDLFQYIKSSINRCSRLNKNITLFQLFGEYARALSSYAALLDSHLSKKPLDTSTFTPSELLLSCTVINTSNYILETLPGLVERVEGMMEGEMKGKVEVEGVKEEYSILINKSVQILVASLYTRLNKTLLNVTKMPWSTWNQVGDESKYVGECAAILREELPSLISKLSPKYHPFLFSQIASTFIPRYVDSIYKCRRIGEMGAQQMSLDAHALKNVLLSVPTLGTSAPSSSKPPSAPPAYKTYVKYVSTEMGKAEALLKTLVSPNERLIVTFKALLPKSSMEDLMRVSEEETMERSD